MIRVTLTCTLGDWWGADDQWDDGGPEAVKELLLEDVAALIEDCKWEIIKIVTGDKP